MEERLLEIAYEFYPRGIDYLSHEREANIKYLNSKEYLHFESKKKEFFGRNKDYAKDLINTIKKNCLNIEFRDASRIESGDRAFLIQHSGFFFKNKLKYYPFCLGISALIPYYFFYVLDIDILIEEEMSLGKYKWKKNNGLFYEWKENKEFAKIYSEISNFLNENYELKEFPEFLFKKKINDINNNNIEFGDFTYFNAFFLDDLYCLP